MRSDNKTLIRKAVPTKQQYQLESNEDVNSHARFLKNIESHRLIEDLVSSPLIVDLKGLNNGNINARESQTDFNDFTDGPQK